MMADHIKENIKEQSTWVRAFYMIVMAILYSLTEFVILAVVVFQFLSKLVTAKTNERLLGFGKSLSTYIYQIMLFLTYNTEEKPFPFAEWPSGGPGPAAASTGAKGAGGKKRPARSRTAKGKTAATESGTEPEKKEPEPGAKSE